jgi:DNA mismatch endonuclease, patch repair protein
MTDVLTKEQRSYNMSRIRSAHTAPEMRVRKLLHGMGFRYRLHGKALPGKPDLVFARARAVLFVHGCFWKPVPATNRTFWADKRRSNVERDKRNRAALKAQGWRVFEIWECQVRKGDTLIAKLQPLIEFLGGASLN